MRLHRPGRAQCRPDSRTARLKPEPLQRVVHIPLAARRLRRQRHLRANAPPHMMRQRLAERAARRAVRRIPVRHEDHLPIQRYRSRAEPRHPEHRPGVQTRGLPQRQGAFRTLRNEQRAGAAGLRAHHRLRARRKPRHRAADRPEGRLAHLHIRLTPVRRDQNALTTRDTAARIRGPDHQRIVMRAHQTLRPVAARHTRHIPQPRLRQIRDPPRRQIGRSPRSGRSRRCQRSRCSRGRDRPGLSGHVAHQSRAPLCLTRRLKCGLLLLLGAPGLKPRQRRRIRLRLLRTHPAPPRRLRQNRREVLTRLLIAAIVLRDQIKQIATRIRRVIFPKAPLRTAYLHHHRTVRLRAPFRSSGMCRLSKRRPEQILRPLP